MPESTPNTPPNANDHPLWAFAARDETIIQTLTSSLGDPEISVVIAAIRALCRVQPRTARDFLAKSSTRKQLLNAFQSREPMMALMTEVDEAAGRITAVTKTAPWRFDAMDEYGVSDYEPPVEEAARLPIYLSILDGRLAPEATRMDFASVVQAIGETKQHDAVSALLRMARSGDDSFAKAAFHALGTMGDCSTLSEVEALARKSGSGIRVSFTYAIESLRRVEREAAHLVATLSDPKRLARIEQRPGVLIERLAATGYREGLECVRECLHSPDARARVSAARALGRLRAAEACEELVRLAEGEDEAVAARMAAIRALGRTRDARAAEPLAKLMTHGVEDLRAAAVRAAGNLRRKRLIKGLGKILLTDSLRFVKAENTRVVEMAMTKIGDEYAAAAVGPGLRSRDMKIRVKFVDVLGHVIGPHSVAALLKAGTDPTTQVRAAATAALAEQVTFELI